MLFREQKIFCTVSCFLRLVTMKWTCLFYRFCIQESWCQEFSMLFMLFVGAEIEMNFFEKLLAHWNSLSGDVNNKSVFSCKLVKYACLLTVPSTPSQASLPWDVAKKFHSALIPKSFLWLIKFKKLYSFLYCDAAPSEK